MLTTVYLYVRPGGIPLLASLLSTFMHEPRSMQFLNLSICEEKKGKIISSRAVTRIVHVLKRGSMEAWENAAGTLFSLSVVDESKVTIGDSGAIPPLVMLSSEGSLQGKKDAATALFNLCIYQDNNGKSVRAGMVPTLMGLFTEAGGRMVDEALVMLAIQSSNPEGVLAIGTAESVTVLVEVIRSGSSRNKENAETVLVRLCNGEQQQQHLGEAWECGVMGPLEELAQTGKRKAVQLLQCMKRFPEQQKQAYARAEAQAQAQSQTRGQSQTQVEQLTSPSWEAFLDR